MLAERLVDQGVGYGVVTGVSQPTNGGDKDRAVGGNLGNGGGNAEGTLLTKYHWLHGQRPNWDNSERIMPNPATPTLTLGQAVFSFNVDHKYCQCMCDAFCLRSPHFVYKY